MTPAENDALDQGRLARVQAELAAADCAGCLLFDPINLRYATGTARSSLWNMHGATRYAFLPTAGRVVLFDNPSAHHVYGERAVIAEYRPAKSTCYWVSGPRQAEVAAACMAEIAELLASHGGASKRLAVDRLDPSLIEAALALDLSLVAAGPLLERARAVKLAGEIDLLRASVALCDQALAEIRETLRPGITEIALWSRLQGVNGAGGGEWIETRLLSSGPRTRPWYQEASDRVIQAGELVAVDSDIVGPSGYLADISRTMLAGDGPASGDQRDLYGLAYEQIQTNMALIKPGVGFKELAEASWHLPARFRRHRYLCVAHGAGMCNEYPNIVYPEDYAAGGYDGRIEAGMVLCVESYLAADDSREGVKLEEQVVVTETGCEPLSGSPFDQRLLS